MRVGVVCALICLSFFTALAADYELFYENGKAGLRDETGKVVIPASFDALGWTDGSFSVVNQVTGYRQNGKWGLINLKKEYLTKAEFETLTSSGADRVIASKWINSFTRKFGCLDLQGNVVVPFHYDGISIRGLRAIVFVKNGTRYEYGLIDLNNKSILPIRYREIKPVGTLRLAVQNFDQKTALFNEDGVALTEFSIDSISAFKKGKAIVYQKFKQGIINREGEFEKEPQYREIRINEAGDAEARAFEEWKILTATNSEAKKIVADQLTLSGNQYIGSLSGKFGLLTTQFDEVKPFEFDQLTLTTNGLAVAKKGKYGLIRTRGAAVLPFTFDSVCIDRSFVRVQSRPFGAKVWSVYDTFGVKKTDKYYEQLEPYNGKYFRVSNYGFQGGVDRYGKEILSCVYDSILAFNYAHALVKFKNQYGIVDFNEKWVLLPQSKKLELVNETSYLEHGDSTVYLKKFTGEMIYFTTHRLVPRETHLEEWNAVGEMRKISLDGVDISPTHSANTEGTEQVFEASEGLRGILRDGRYGFVDARGRLRIANRYEGIGKFREGIAPVKILGKWGFVNTEDKIVINPSYEYVEELSRGVAIASRNKRFGLIDKSGKILLEFRYDSIQRVGNKFTIKTDSKFGLTDENGRVLIEPRFESLQLLDNGNVLVRSERHWGVLTYDGLSVIPTIYDDLIYDATRNQYLAHQKTNWVKLN